MSDSLNNDTITSDDLGKPPSITDINLFQATVSMTTPYASYAEGTTSARAHLHPFPERYKQSAEDLRLAVCNYLVNDKSIYSAINNLTEGKKILEAEHGLALDISQPFTTNILRVINPILLDKPHLRKFGLNFNTVRYRIVLMPTAGDDLFILARQNEQTPRTIDEARIDKSIAAGLIESLNKGGLTCITGPYAQGKTGTAATILTEYLTQHGGLAVTIELPAEYSIEGPVGTAAVCIQYPQLDISDPAIAAQISSDIRKSYASIIFIGEIDSPATAALAYDLALTGNAVLATSHGENIPQAIDNIAQLLNNENISDGRALLASILTTISEQNLTPDGPVISTLYNIEKERPDSPVSTAIINNDATTIQRYKDFQTGEIAENGILPVSLEI